MASRVLIMYWHGLGDLLCLTPQLRYLHQKGFVVDLLVRPQVLSSSLLDTCPYVQSMFPLPFTEGGPSEGGESGKEKAKDCNELFEHRRSSYDFSVKISGLPNNLRRPGGKIIRNSKALFEGSKIRVLDLEAKKKRNRDYYVPKKPLIDIPSPSDLNLEVFIPTGIQETVKKFIAKTYPDGFIFKHTDPEYHPNHKWDANQWTAKNLPPLPIYEASASPWKDVNGAFVMAREATHRVLSSSVFVHACDAMNVPMDVVHYGKPNPHGLPLDSSKILTYHGNSGKKND